MTRAPRSIAPASVIAVIVAACTIVASACAPPGVAPAIGDVIASVAVTTLPGASTNAGTKATLVDDDATFGKGAAPAISNTIVSAFPGAPSKPLFVAQADGFDD